MPVTRTQIKRVGSLGQAPVAVALQVGQDLFNYFMAQSVNNRMKTFATTEAEGFVKAFWSHDPCGDPKASIQNWNPNPQTRLSQITTYPNPSPIFCEDCVAGMIERCNLSDASEFLQWLAQSMTAQAQRDPTQGRFLNWYNEYGMGTIMDATLALQKAESLCPSATTITTSTTPTISASDVLSSIPTSWLILGGIGLFGLWVATKDS